MPSLNFSNVFRPAIVYCINSRALWQNVRNTNNCSIYGNVSGHPTNVWLVSIGKSFLGVSSLSGQPSPVNIGLLETVGEEMQAMHILRELAKLFYKSHTR